MMFSSGNHFRVVHRPHTTKDWLGISIIIAAGILSAAFMFEQTEIFQAALAEQTQIDNYAFQALMYKWNVVHSDSTPEKSYEALRQALLNNDLEGALGWIHPKYLWKYRDGLKEAGEAGRLSDAVARLTPLTKKIREYGNVVRYEHQDIPGNNNPNPLERYSEEVEFMQDYDGIWKVSSI